MFLRQFILIIQLRSGNLGLNSPNSAITDIHSFCLLKWNCFILCSFASWKIRFYLLITIFHSLIFLNTQASQCFSTHTDASYSTFWNNPAYDWTWLPVWLKRQINLICFIFLETTCSVVCKLPYAASALSFTLWTFLMLPSSWSQIEALDEKALHKLLSLLRRSPRCRLKVNSSRWGTIPHLMLALQA